MSYVVEVNGLSKKYSISHHKKASYSTIKDDFSGMLKKLRGSSDTEEKKEDFWALKDVSFSVKKGEVFGVIGHNGSGKSTLLKILSRVIEPTSGEAIMRGKVASLLEVGTGFHPELTGRENIFFNGSMLGMSRKEIRSKFDEIIAFSEIEKFLDTPVKFYSSGMYVRLAFAVAAHLDPDILILDEVLSVGDAKFQKKSLDKMLEIANSGKTIIYVSHGLSSVEKLCERAMLLDHGEVKMIGDSTSVAEKYLEINNLNIDSMQTSATDARSGSNNKKSKDVPSFISSYRKSNGVFIRQDKDAMISKVTLENIAGQTTSAFRFEQDLIINLETKKLKDDRQFAVEIRIKDEAGSLLGFTSSLIGGKMYNPGDKVKIILKNLNLVEGSYCIDFICRSPHEYHVDNWWDTVGFRIMDCKPKNYPIHIGFNDALGSVLLESSEFHNA